MKKSTALFKKYHTLINDAEQSIIEFLKSHDLECVDLTLDSEGNDFECEDYDESWVQDNRVWHTCSGKYDLVDGELTEVKLINPNDNPQLVCNAVDIYGTEYFDQQIDLGTMIDLLERLENTFWISQAK